MVLDNIDQIKYIDLTDCTISIDSKNFQIQNPIFEIMTNVYDLIINTHMSIFDIITLVSFISFWCISLLLFLQGLEILINYTNFFNNKNSVNINNKNFINITSKLLTHTSNKFTHYYL